MPRKQFEEHKQLEAAAGRNMKPNDTKWSDTNNGSGTELEIRSRLPSRPK